MKCKICECKDISIIYDDKIRNGSFGHFTEMNYKMYKCGECGTIWHDFPRDDYVVYYESEKYREDVLGGGIGRVFLSRI